MTEVLLHHHIQGLTEGVSAFADELRRAGHVVHTPDLFDGRTFATIGDGFASAREAGMDRLDERGAAAADGLPSDVVYAGFSFGVSIAQRLAQTRSGSRGALLLHSCIPFEEFGPAWPVGVPAQIHWMAGDEFFEEDLPAARALAAAAPGVELFVYPGDQHLFTDSSLESHDPEAAALVTERALELLAAV